MQKRCLLLGMSLLLVMVMFFGMISAENVQAKERVAIVYATGGLGDKSFNDSANEGMKMAAKIYKLEFDQAEPIAITEYETFLTQFAATGRYKLIISIGFDQADALNNVATRFPKQKFAIIDMVVNQANVASYVYDEKERGFLIGVASALMTTKNDDPRINAEKKIGVIGGMKIPLIDANIAGFIAGAKYIDPKVEVRHSYVGNWADPAKGKELTLSMIENGVDIIWGAAGRSGLGVIKAAEEKNCFAIGADSDQAYLAPENVLTNGMKFVNNTVLLAIDQVLNDEFKPGVHVLGVKDGVLGYTNSLLPDDIIQKLEEVKIKIINNEVVIPGTVEEAK